MNKINNCRLNPTHSIELFCDTRLGNVLTGSINCDFIIAATKVGHVQSIGLYFVCLQEWQLFPNSLVLIVEEKSILGLACLAIETYSMG